MAPRRLGLARFCRLGLAVSGNRSSSCNTDLIVDVDEPKVSGGAVW